MANITIISGASGEIGRALKTYFESKGNIVYGFSSQEFEDLHKLNFLDKKSVEAFFENNTNEIKNAEQINFLHLIGPFKTEMDLLTGEQSIENPREGDGIDQEVYRSTVETFRNGVDAICKTKNKEQKLFLSIIGSISDKYDIKYFKSSRESKNILRKEIENLSKNNSEIFGRVLNVSSVFTKKEFQERPFVSKNDLDTWLTLEQLLSIIEKENIFQEIDTSYREIDIFNKKEGFDPNKYYTDENMYITRVIQRTGKTPEELSHLFKTFYKDISSEIGTEDTEVNEIKSVAYHNEKKIMEIQDYPKMK